ncbi:sensor histidine kinase [Blastococcus sp. PRF04-17]|uniref:sensor histidine kinase n=1 Tax=Blastococcus sp. PRF04-17 TaxID=2933797 RepID=UPI001FF6592F|nr:histidine kinase [Blastococcus sp. PRF04-17]UOY03253.1 histidine kinase [Blastococcus sp. PRF04-17]
MPRTRVLSALAAATIVAANAVWVWLDEAAGAPEFLFGSVVFLTLAAVLRLAVRAGRRAAVEHARAARLASTPEADVARAAVAVERARLAGDIQAVVRSAATTMGAAADDAVRRWDDDPTPALNAVQEHGQRAGLELRRLLGLLREADEDVEVRPRPEAAVPRISRRDVLLAAAVTALAVAENFAYRGEFPAGATMGAVSVLLTICAAATVVLRRVAPELGATLCGLVFAVGIWTQPLPAGFWLIAGPAALAWAAAARGVRSVPALGVLGAGVGAEMWIRDPDNVFLALLTLALAAVGGAAVRAGERWQLRAQERADRRAAELDAAAGAAVRAERLAVARELHDLVSHAVGVMVMQAGAALATREGDPARARRALDVVRRTAGETLAELDRLVEVLDHGVLGAAMTPPDGHDLDALLERLRGAGLAVRSDVDGELSGEGAAVVYRVVQESLTNVLRHAPGAAAVVRVRADATGVEVEVVDDGPGPGSAPRRGYGLVGLDERVRRVGGEFAAGPGPGGGFRVHVRIPALAARPA